MNQLALQCFKYLTAKSIVQMEGVIVELACTAFKQQNEDQNYNIDPDFPHLNRSITKQVLKKSIVWMPASSLIQGEHCYSQSIDNIEFLSFSKISIKNSLLIMKWFRPTIFEQILKNQKVQANGIYSYKIMHKGIIVNLHIDEYVPVLSGQQIFAKHYKNAIFPNLYEKMFAKAYGDYSQISDSIIDLVQMQTMFCRQQKRTSQIKGQQQSLALLIATRLSSDSLAFFKTKRGKQLQVNGLSNSKQYIISRILKINDKFIVEFLQMQQIQGNQKYRGSFSKFSQQSWQKSLKQCQLLNINFSLSGRQNYMLVSDLIIFSKNLTFLCNTEQFNKTWISELNNKKQLKFYRFQSKNKFTIMLKTCFIEKCRNTIFLIKQQDQNIEAQYFLKECSFKPNKLNNFIQATLPGGRYYLVIYCDVYTQSVSEGVYDDIGCGFVITVFATEQIILQQRDKNMQILQKCLITYLKRQNYPKLDIDLKNNSFAIMKHSYEKMGIGMIYLEIGLIDNGKALIQIFHQNLSKNYIQPFNFDKQVYQIRNNSKKIFIFKCFWEKFRKYNDVSSERFGKNISKINNQKTTCNWKMILLHKITIKSVYFLSFKVLQRYWLNILLIIVFIS